MSKALREEDVVVEALRVGASERAGEARVESPSDEPLVVDEIVVEELAIDGICGVY